MESESRQDGGVDHVRVWIPRTMALATLKDNQKKNWALDNIFTLLQMTGKFSKYIEIFGHFGDFRRLATVCSY